MVGIVSVNFRKAFDSISHHVLLKKLQAVGAAGELWCWIKDYSADRSQATVVNGFQSETLPVIPSLTMSCWISYKQSVLQANYGAGLKITQLTALKLQS